MRTNLVVVGVACAAALARPHAPSRPDPRASPDPRLRPREDSRRVQPGVHRASPAELAVRNRFAALEAARARQRALDLRRALDKDPRAVSVASTAWVSLGPTDAAKEENDAEIAGVDSGRPNSIVVDPRDPNVVYLGLSGGGVWKTFDFLSKDGPTWSPSTDLQPSLAVGALAMDRDDPDTLYVGNGDFVDAAGNTIQKTRDGGSTWSAPVVLDGTYPPPGGVAAHVRAIRSIDVHGATVLAGTNVGLFASTDGGASFTLVDLPNPHGKVLAEAIWSVVHVGGGQWVASGLAACAEGVPPPGLARGQDPGPSCAEGNDGVVWRSTDGVTWAQVTLPTTTGTGRITLAAGDTSDPARTPLYAYVGSVDGFHTVGYWRSLDGGVTWKDATGTLANPTQVYTNPDNSTGQDCESLDVGHDQTWYNQSIAVDPTNPDHVLIGGNLCGARTLNGTADAPTWELVSHWLPAYQNIGTTDRGQLPYVHADWHTAVAVATPTGVRAFAGTDGGIFTSTDVFDASVQAEQVTWRDANRGLATHLMYALASGDPVSANPFVLFAGLQDNGTRFRTAPATPSVFNQPIGGDGIGATVHVATSGTTYWASYEFGRLWCRPSADVDCAVGKGWTQAPSVAGDPFDEDRGPAADGDARDRGPARPATADGAADDDSEPFLVHYANVETDVDGQRVLSHSTGRIVVSVPQPDGSFEFAAISQDLSPLGWGFSNVTASRTIAGLYGAPTTRSTPAPFYVTTTGTTPSTWTAAQPVHPKFGTTLSRPSSIDFPPVTPPGKQPGDVFVGAFTGTLGDGGTPPPDDQGRLYRTTDHGQTWTSIVGADPLHRLPNVPVYVVKYDPIAATTLYAGTELGVYVSTDDGATWDRLGEGFPMVQVRDLYVARNQEFIRAATYGRGLWEIYPSAAASHGAVGNGDYDRNLRIDWVDVAAMASRVGVTPATTTAPFYSWIMDLTGDGSDPPVQSIDGADLEALLARFGGHP